MAYEKRPGSGTLFTNDRKKKDTHADRRGDALICCPSCNENFEVWLDGWIKKGPNGQFLSLAIKAKDARPADRPGERERGERYDKIARGPQQKPVDPDLDPDDESPIPF